MSGTGERDLRIGAFFPLTGAWHLATQTHLLSLLEVFLQGVGEPLGVLDKLPLPLFERLLARGPGDVGRDLVDGVQQLLYGARDLPGNERRERKLLGDEISACTHE